MNLFYSLCIYKIVSSFFSFKVEFYYICIALFVFMEFACALKTACEADMTINLHITISTENLFYSILEI